MQKKFLLLFLSLALFVYSFAQVRGTTVSVTKPLPFNQSFSNVMLDPNPVTGAGSRVQYVEHFSSAATPAIGLNAVLGLIGGDVSIPGWLTSLSNGAGFFCSGVTPRFSIDGSIDVGGYYQVRSVGNSNIDVDYPVQVQITYPEANTFACGDVIRINTSYSILQPTATKLKVKPPFVNQEIGPIINNLRFGASIGVNAWVGYGTTFYYPCPTETNPFRVCSYQACGGQQYFNDGVSFSIGTSLPQLPALVNICENAFGPNANNATLLGCNWSALTPLLNLGQSALNAYNSMYGTNYTFAEFPDQHTVTIAPPDLPDGGPTLPEMQGTFKDVSNTELNYAATNNGNTLTVNGRKSFISQMSFDLVSLLDYAGVTTSKSLGGGQGSIDVGDISPTMTIDQTFDFKYDPVVHLQVNLGASMAYSVYQSNGGLDHSGTGQFVDLLAGQYIDAVVPAAQTTPLSASGSSSLDGQFSSNSSQEYFRSLQLAFGQVNMPGVISNYTLLQTELLKAKFGEKSIIDHSFNLALPNSITLPSFVIDPENPVIDVSYLNTEDIRNIGDGKRKVVYKAAVTNGGDVKLNNVQSTIDLAAAFASSQGYRVLCITSAELAVNSSFNGGSNKNLLAAGNELAIGQTKYLEIVVEVKPAISTILPNKCFGTVDYTISSKATATSPIGTNIKSDFKQCTMEVTAPDITTLVDLGANKLTALKDFTIYGWKGVVFDKNFNTSYGNVGSYDDLVFENVSYRCDDPVKIVGDLHVRDRIRLLGESRVVVDYVQNAGPPVINNSRSGLFPTGKISNYSSCVVSIPKLNIVKPANWSNVSINVPSRGTITLSPGSYKTITLQHHSTLILLPGVYNIDTWRFFGDDANVKYQLNNQKITIHVDKFQPLQRDDLEMTIDGAGKVADITIYVYGNQPSKFSHSRIQGTIVSPDAEVEFDNCSLLEGACYAEKVNFKDRSIFKGASYTVPLKVSAACQGTDDCEDTPPPSFARPSINEFDISEDIVAKQITGFPNPVIDKFTITGLDSDKPSVITLYDIQGRQLKVYKTGTHVYVIDFKDLKSGAYILKVEGSNQVFKVIKQ